MRGRPRIGQIIGKTEAGDCGAIDMDENTTGDPNEQEHEDGRENKAQNFDKHMSDTSNYKIIMDHSVNRG